MTYCYYSDMSYDASVLLNLMMKCGKKVTAPATETAIDTANPMKFEASAKSTASANKRSY